MKGGPRSYSDSSCLSLRLGVFPHRHSTVVRARVSTREVSGSTQFVFSRIKEPAASISATTPVIESDPTPLPSPETREFEYPESRVQMDGNLGFLRGHASREHTFSRIQVSHPPSTGLSPSSIAVKTQGPNNNA